MAVPYHSLVLLLVFVGLQYGSCLRCFSCTEVVAQNKSCEDPWKYSGSLTTDICPDKNLCVTYTRKSLANNLETISRTCGEETICTKLREQDAQLNMQTTSCRTCKTDFCKNSVGFFGSSIMAVIGCVVFSKIIV